MPSYMFGGEIEFHEGQQSVSRVTDPSGNEHKITFIYKDGFWEVV